jgi:serine/threonine protein kinase
MSSNRVTLVTTTDIDSAKRIAGRYSLDSTGDQILQTALAVLNLPPGSRYPLLLRRANGEEQLILPDSRLHDFGALNKAVIVVILSGRAIPSGSIPPSASLELLHSIDMIRSPGRCPISQFYVDLFNYELMKECGSGSYSSVSLAKHKTTGDIVAIKQIRRNTGDLKREQMFEREVEILGTVRHPALLNLCGCTPYVADGEALPMIVIPFMSNGSVDDLLKLERDGKAPAEWTPTQKQIVLFGIASGMAFLHDHRVIHRDLKPDNVLLEDRFEPKISDFGLSKFVALGESLKQSMDRGTPWFKAPEMYTGLDFGFKVDVYAFGILMYMIVTVSNRFLK